MKSARVRSGMGQAFREEKMKIVSWFSAGVSSAIATKLLIDEIDEIYYIHIEDHHIDTLRFVGDCERWFGKEIKQLQAIRKDVETACRMSGGRGYINKEPLIFLTYFLPYPQELCYNAARR